MRILLVLLLGFGAGNAVTFETRAAEAAATAAPTDSTQTQLEDLAKRHTHFALTTVVGNRSLRLGGYPERKDALVADQDRLLEELRALCGNRDPLAALLKHTDPKVRTLALGALFQREDGRDLPLIATLINDDAGTFPLLHESRRSGGPPSPMSELENPQSVGQVAQAMLNFWGVPGTGRVSLTGNGLGNIRAVTANDFRAYWIKYESRAYAASWFKVKMDRATRRTTPSQPQYRTDIERVVAQMDTLPPADRAWTRLFVLAPGGWNDDYLASQRLVPDQDLVETTRQLGPEALLRFLRHEPVTDDPDLRMEKKENSDFVRVANFILLHAGQLLRPEDADALLVCEKAERGASGANPAWAMAAAALQPMRARETLRLRLQNENRNSLDAAGRVAGALWRISGPPEKDFLAAWFYEALKTASDPFHQPEIFLQEVRVAARPDTKEMLMALMRHPRFELTDWAILKEMLKIINAKRSSPLVNERDLYDASPSSAPEQKTVLAKWRTLLRREYELSERPLPESSPTPRLILTEPSYSKPLAQRAKQLIVSADGRLLATLTEEGSVELWEASSGTQIGSIPRRPEAWCWWMGFEETGDRLTLAYQDPFAGLNHWDVTARNLIRRVSLTGPSSGVAEGAYAFDGVAGRVGLAGANDVVCFDCQSGKALWQHPDQGGVRSVVALSRDGKLMAVGGGHRDSRTVHLFDAANGQLLRTIDKFGGRIEAMAFSADGQTLATATAEDGPCLWNAQTGKLVRQYSYPARGKAAALVFSPDGRWLGIVGTPYSLSESRIGIFRAATGELEYELRREHHFQDWYSLLAFSPDGKVVHTAGKQLEAWRLK